jgi:hypothetical protein
MLPPNLPSVDTPTPMTPLAALTSPPPKKKSTLTTPSPELWVPPLPLLPTSPTGIPSSLSLPMEPPSPETNLTLLCNVSLLQQEELSLRRSLRTRATTSSTRPQGRSATTSPSPRPRLIAFATLSQSVRTVPHLDLSRLDRAMGPRRSWQEVVQRWRDQQLTHTQEVQQARRRRVIESRQSLVTRARRSCSQLSTPSSD